MSIILENITKFFGKQKVLDNLSLEIKTGEFHVILGPSGEGKSTLLSIIAGLIKPDKGKIWIDGKLINNFPPQKRNIGFVFQDFALFPHLNVFENVAYGLRIRGIKNKELEKKVRFYLKMVGLEKYENKYPPELSGGQKQRVALARALATNPKVLLLDEPLSHIDAWQRERLREELKYIQKQTGITTIYVTHDQIEARLLADRVSILHKGKIEQVEPPEELFYQPKTDFVAKFVGAGNILRGKIVEIYNKKAIFVPENSKYRFTVRYYPIFREKKEIALCLHPERIVLSKEPIKENHLLAKILQIRYLTVGYRIKLCTENLIFEAYVFDKNFSEGDIIWMCFDAEALHPLCGRCFREPPEFRRCRLEGL